MQMGILKGLLRSQTVADVVAKFNDAIEDLKLITDESAILAGAKTKQIETLQSEIVDHLAEGAHARRVSDKLRALVE